MAEYPQTKRNTLGRLKARGVYDFETVHNIVNSASILHVSFPPTNPEDDPFPTILPMLGHLASFENPSADPASEHLDLYLHGSSVARMMRLASSSSDPEGLLICVAATHMDGIVLALAPFHNSCNYRSAVLHGYATLVTSPDEILFALTAITDGLVPQRWANSRAEPTKAELTSTAVLKVKIASASAKIRAGGPGDDKADLGNDELMARTWTGVLPMWEQMGEFLEAPSNKCKAGAGGVMGFLTGTVPAYLRSWREERNKRSEGYAVGAAQSLKK